MTKKQFWPSSKRKLMVMKGWVWCQLFWFGARRYINGQRPVNLLSGAIVPFCSHQTFWGWLLGCPWDWRWEKEVGVLLHKLERGGSTRLPAFHFLESAHSMSVRHSLESTQLPCHPSRRPRNPRRSSDHQLVQSSYHLHIDRSSSSDHRQAKSSKLPRNPPPRQKGLVQSSDHLVIIR